MAGNGNSFPFFENVTTLRRKILSQQTLENFESPEPLKPAPKPHPVGQCKSCLHRIHLLVGHEPVYKLCSLEPPEIKQSFDHCVSLERHANSKLYQICKCVFDKHGRTLMSAHTSRKRESFLSHTLYAYHMCSFQIVPCKNWICWICDATTQHGRMPRGFTRYTILPPTTLVPLRGQVNHENPHWKQSTKWLSI